MAKVLVMPTSSGEFDVQVEQDNDRVSNFQVVRPATMLAAFPDEDPRHIVEEAMRYLLERAELGASRSVALDALWSNDRAFASSIRDRLG
jgi:hypothetical protein